MTKEEILELSISDIYYILNQECDNLTADEKALLEEQLKELEAEAEAEELREQFGEQPEEFNCPKCDALISSDNTKCPYCNYVFQKEDYYNTIDNPTSSVRDEKSSDFGSYVVGFFFPMVGIIIGLIRIAKSEEKDGVGLIIFSIVCSIINGIVLALLFMN